MKICPKCKQVYDDNSVFCEQCENEDGSGVKLVDAKECPNCGKTIRVDVKRCSYCGANTLSLGNNAESIDAHGNAVRGDLNITKNSITNIINKDESTATAKCSICGSIIKKIEGYECKGCNEFVCSNCYDINRGICKNCADKILLGNEQQYIQKVKEWLSTTEYLQYEGSHQDSVNEIAKELGVSEERAEYLKYEEIYLWLNDGVKKGEEDAIISLARAYDSGKFLDKRKKSILDDTSLCLLRDNYNENRSCGYNAALADAYEAHRDYETAINFYIKANDLWFKEVEFDSGIWLYKVGLCYQKLGSYTEAVEWYSRAIEEETYEAAINLGWLYINEFSRPEDGFNIFLEFYKRGEISEGENYNVIARSLGDCYRLGIGTQMDLQKAVDAYNSALPKPDVHTIAKPTERTYGEAWFGLGECFSSGMIDNWDYAVQCYQKSAECKNADAMYQLYLYYKNIADNNELSDMWLKKAMNAGYKLN